MANVSQQRKETVNTVYDYRRSCGVCSVLRRFFSARPCNRSSDTRIINWVVAISFVVLGLLGYSTVHTAIFLSNKTLELARLQKDDALTKELLSMSLYELAQVDIYTFGKDR